MKKYTLLEKAIISDDENDIHSVELKKELKESLSPVTISEGDVLYTFRPSKRVIKNMSRLLRFTDKYIRKFKLRNICCIKRRNDDKEVHLYLVLDYCGEAYYKHIDYIGGTKLRSELDDWKIEKRVQKYLAELFFLNGYAQMLSCFLNCAVAIPNLISGLLNSSPFGLGLACILCLPLAAAFYFISKMLKSNFCDDFI